jgi:hypothetical protein
MLRFKIPMLPSPLIRLQLLMGALALAVTPIMPTAAHVASASQALRQFCRLVVETGDVEAPMPAAVSLQNV